MALDHETQELPDEVALAAERAADLGVATVADYFPKKHQVLPPPPDPLEEAFAPEQPVPTKPKTHHVRASRRGGRSFPERSEEELESGPSEVLPDPVAERRFREEGRSGEGFRNAKVVGVLAMHNVVRRETEDLPENYRIAIELARLDKATRSKTPPKI